MRFYRLPLVCKCGRAPSNVNSVGLTAARELVVHWTCPACRKHAKFVMPMTDSCRTRPQKEQTDPARVECEFLPEDIAFLHSIRVKV